MFRIFIPVVAATLLALISLSPASTAHATQACPANPSPPDAADPSMILDEPLEGATVTSPVHVSGLARVFEANVRITVYSASGMVLTDTFTTAAEAGPALAPFAADVSFAVVSEQAGCIRVWEESAADGSPRNVVQVGVNLAPAAVATATPTPAPVTPPDTGDAGLASSRPTAVAGAAVLGTLVVILALSAVRLRREA